MEKLLTISEVAEILRLTPQTIYKMIGEGTLSAVKIGSQWRISEIKMQEWIHQSTYNKEKEGEHHG